MMRLGFTMLTAALVLLSPGTSAGDDLDSRIRDYILNNPDVILEALNIMAAREAAAQQATQIAAFPQLFAEPARHGIGEPDASIKVIEFFDYRCAPCKAIHPKLVDLVENTPDLRIEMRQLPILSPGSERAARFALASEKVAGADAYARVHDRLFETRGVLNSAAFENIAKTEGLDFAAITAEMEADDISARIDYNRDVAIGLGVVGTPAFVTKTTLSVGQSDVNELAKLWLNQ